jgi:molybdopterin converting factor small subunit
MTVTVVCFGAIRDYLPHAADGNRVSVNVDQIATVADAVDALGAPRRLVYAVLVDGVQSTLDAQLHENAEVTLMPPFAGG